MRVNKVQDKPTEDFHGAVMRRVICEDEEAPNFCMRVFEIPSHSSTPFHSHPYEHEVLVLSGQGVAKGEQGESQVAKDIAVYIPPDEKHCFMNKGSEPLRFV